MPKCSLHVQLLLLSLKVNFVNRKPSLLNFPDISTQVPRKFFDILQNINWFWNFVNWKKTIISCMHELRKRKRERERERESTHTIFFSLSRQLTSGISALRACLCVCVCGLAMITNYSYSGRHSLFFLSHVQRMLSLSLSLSAVIKFFDQVAFYMHDGDCIEILSGISFLFWSTSHM